MSRARDLADGTFSGAFSADSPTLVVDAANNRVGINEPNPDYKLDVEQVGGDAIRINAGSDFSGLRLTSTAGEWSVRTSTADALMFYDASSAAERARIDSDGRLLVNTTSTTNTANRFEVRAGASQYAAEFRKTDTNDQVLTIFRHDGATGGTSRALLWFENSSGTGVGSIKATGSATSFNTSSDYRLKENITELTGAIDRVKQVPVHRFNFIADPDTTVDGFLAHEVADVVPEAITGTKDEVDADGNPVYQGIDQSKLVPLLTAAIKEQQALIEDLQTRLAALETP